MNLRSAVVLLLVSALSGCAAEAPDSEDVAPNMVGFSKWILSDCIGMDTAKDYVLQQGPGEAPPGWQFDPLAAGRYETYAAMTLLSCNRFSGFGLERGPINFLIETHSKFSPPEGCEYGRLDRMAILHQWFTNDDAVAAALVSIGIPAVPMTLNLEFQNSTGLTTQKWSWEVPGSGASNLQMTGQTDPGSSVPLLERLVSWDGEQLSVLDVAWKMTTAQPPIPITYGELSSGMLVSGPAEQTYVDDADMDLEVEARIDLKQFGDTECQEPL